MHIIFQFPLIDFRSVLADDCGKLKNPEWPQPSVNAKPFIRHFGSVKQRLFGGSTEFPGEEYYCDAHLSMHYENLHKQGFSVSAQIQSSIYNSYRRYYSDGYFLGKIEAGFIDNTEELIAKNDLPDSSVQLTSLLEHYSNMAVSINKIPAKLYKAGPLLAKKFYEQTTNNKTPVNPVVKTVVAGEISVMLLFSASAKLKFPQNAFLVETIPLSARESQIYLYGFKMPHEGYILKVWLIVLPARELELSKSDLELLRNLRMNLLRIHLEKETIRILLNAIRTNQILLKPDSREAGLVNTYLKKTAEKLFKKERFTIIQKNLLSFALHSEDIIAPGSLETLENGVYFFQDQFTRNNLEKLIAGMAKKTILFICASPRDKNPLDFGDEYKQIKDSLRAGTDRLNYVIELESSVRKADFLDILNRYKPSYLHISMHSSLTEGLYFEDENQDKLPMSVSEFASTMSLFSTTNSLEVIVLSACNSKAHAEAVRECCRFAIGTVTVFPADAGVIYASKFYSTLFEANSMQIPYCHDAGKFAIQVAKQQFDPINGIPVYEIPVLVNERTTWLKS